MHLKIYSTYIDLSYHAAREILQIVKEKPDAVICLASGETPVLCYSLVTQIAMVQKIDFSHVTFIALDEWVGIAPENKGSCHHFIDRHIVEPLKLKKGQVHRFNAVTKDLAYQCRQMDDVIRRRGGLDMIVAGLGLNGHIGFNEPGVPVNLYSHIVDLDEKTKTVGQKYFSKATVLSKGITLGLQHFMEARTALLLASGSHKAAIIEQALHAHVSNAIPATLIRQHAHGIVMLDEAAAKLLPKT